MPVSARKRVVVALLSGALVVGGTALTPASAANRHGGGYHGGRHGHYAGGYHRHYGYYHGGYGYYGPPCVPILGLVSGNFCNGYYY